MTSSASIRHRLSTACASDRPASTSALSRSHPGAKACRHATAKQPMAKKSVTSVRSVQIARVRVESAERSGSSARVSTGATVRTDVTTTRTPVRATQSAA